MHLRYEISIPKSTKKPNLYKIKVDDVIFFTYTKSVAVKNSLYNCKNIKTTQEA